MLVLTRKRGEKIRINGNVTVTLLQILGGKCRIGVDAPNSVPVHRGEVAELIRAELEAARKAENEMWVYAAPGIEVTLAA